MQSKKHSDPDIVALFESEFSPLLGKFKVYIKKIEDARSSKEKYIAMAGCYVFWTLNSGAIKVGRSLSNTRKRALEHIRDNTGGEMRSLENEPKARLILFNLKRIEDIHWAAAVEIFLEKKLKPLIRSKRLG